MPDILLIQPPIRDFYLTAKRTIPYGLACIAAVLRQEGFTVEILDALAGGKSRRLDLPREMSYLQGIYGGRDVSPFSLFRDFKHFGYGFDRIGKLSHKSGARIVGISSLFSAYSEEAIATARAVKEHHPAAVTVLGGHHPTELPESVLSHGCVDFIIRGEGEAGIVDLLLAIRGEREFESVPGIGFRRHDGTMFINPPAVVANLDAMPHPATDLIDSKYYRRNQRPCTVTAASRGCPLRCSYCSVGGAAWSRFRLKSVSTVMAELEQAVDGAGVRFIDFEDENISLRREWFLTLLHKMRERFSGYGIELRAMNGLFPPSLDEEVVLAMKEAGFTALNLSLCTVSRDQLRKFHRPDVRRAFERALVYADRCGMESVGYIIAGAPGQKAEDSLADLLYLARHKVIAGVSVYYPAPGSLDFARCTELDLLPDRFSLMRATAIPISDTTSREESATLLRLGRILNFMKSLSGEETAGVMECSECSREEVEERIAMLARTARANEQRADPRVGPRRAMGKLLAGLFFHDGIIRGASMDGRIWEYPASAGLCLPFRDGLAAILSRPAGDASRI